MPRNIASNGASKKVVNARMEIFGKAQTKYNGIIRCTITVSNFSMCNKLPHTSVGKLQEEDYDYLFGKETLRSIIIHENAR